MKILPIMAALSVALIFSSCEKEYTCQCIIPPDKDAGSITIQRKYKSDALTVCFSRQDQLAKLPGNKNVECDIVD